MFVHHNMLTWGCNFFFFAYRVKVMTFFNISWHALVVLVASMLVQLQEHWELPKYIFIGKHTVF